MNLEKRFWSKINILNEDDCWEWKAGTFNSGYGSFKYKNKSIVASRMVWFLMNGEFPDLLVCHSCDNPLCCNPNHLFLGTELDNSRDMVSKGRSPIGIRHGTVTHPESFPKGENHPQAKLSNKDIVAIRESKDSGVLLSKRYKVTEAMISYIRNRKRR